MWNTFLVLVNAIGFSYNLVISREIINQHTHSLHIISRIAYDARDTLATLKHIATIGRNF